MKHSNNCNSPVADRRRLHTYIGLHQNLFETKSIV